MSPSTLSPDTATGPAEATSPPARRDPLGALRTPGTVERRCADVARAVADGRSGWYLWKAERLEDLGRQLNEAEGAAASDDEAVARLPRGDRWATLRQASPERWAQWQQHLSTLDAESAFDRMADLSVLLVWMDGQATELWRWEEALEPAAGGGASGAGGGLVLDGVARPLQQQSSGDLFAMLDRYTAAGSTPPPPSPPAAADASAGSDAGAAVAATAPQPAATGPSGATRTHAGSPGLAVAALQLAAAGLFALKADDAYAIEGPALRQVDATALRAALRQRSGPPWPALEAVATILARAGQRLCEESTRDGGLARPSRWVRQAIELAAEAPGAGPGRTLCADRLAAALSRRLAAFTPHGGTVLGLPAGDTAAHLWAGRGAVDVDGREMEHSGSTGQVPFHAAAFSLTRTLAGPLRSLGYTLEGLDRLPDTGLGHHLDLLLDSGVLKPRDPQLVDRGLAPTHEAVVEARAVAVHQLRALAPSRVAIDRAAARARAARGGRSHLRIDGAAGW